MGSKEKLLGAITTLYPTYGDKNIVLYKFLNLRIECRKQNKYYKHRYIVRYIDRYKDRQITVTVSWVYTFDKIPPVFSNYFII